MRVVILGLGYSARHTLPLLAAATEIIGTTRDADRAARLAAPDRRVLVTGTDPAPLDAALTEGGYLLVSAGPVDGGDPFLARHGAVITAAAAAGRLQGVIYLSTIGVYGDTAGAWVDEASPVSTSPRAAARLAAEAGWRALARPGLPVAVLRLGGIYGPARNAFVNLRRGTARRVLKPDQVFNRIHVADVAQAIAAALTQGHDGVVNVTDGAPSGADDPILLAADLMGVAAPAPVAYDAATFSPLARSFWEENRRVRADRLAQVLGVTLRYPTFRDGLTALWRDGDWAGDADDRAEASAKFRR